MKALMLGSVAVFALSVGAAQAADYAPPPPGPVPGPVFDWSGPYIGGNVGYGFLDGDIYGSTFLGGTSSKLDDSDITFGGQIGWNFQQGPIVFGVEGDFNFLDLEDDDGFFDFKNTYAVRADYDWFATARGRAGILVSPNLLIYGTGGVAFIDSRVRLSGGGASASDKDVLVGWTGGAGIEYMFSDALSAKIEYLYANFEDHDVGPIVPFVGPPASGGAEPELHIIRAGLNWHFCTGLGC